MKVNKPKSPFVSGADAPDEKDIAKAIKGEKFAEMLSGLDSSAATDAAPSPARAALTEIAEKYNLSNENEREQALSESAEFLIKSRLGEKYQNAEKIVGDLTKYVADDPFLKNKLLSVLQKLNPEK